SILTRTARSCRGGGRWAVAVGGGRWAADLREGGVFCAAGLTARLLSPGRECSELQCCARRRFSSRAAAFCVGGIVTPDVTV
ncbi:MAG: hypothetical protein ACKPJD_29030, partial [Planctomycetaceae bacterium]